jgi:hypothetical protein
MNWMRLSIQADINPILKHFERWMIDKGYREATIDDYIKAVRLYLGTVKKTAPSICAIILRKK